MLVQQPFGMITFSTYGLLACDNTGQETNISLLDLLMQPGFTKDIEVDNNFLLDPQTTIESLEISIEPVNTNNDQDFDWLNTFIVTTSEDEFKVDIKQENIEEESEFVSSDNSTTSEEKLESPISILEDIKPILEKDWPTQLKEAILPIYNNSLDNNQMILQYYKLGHILSTQSQKYLRDISDIKKNIEDTLGK